MGARALQARPRARSGRAPPKEQLSATHTGQQQWHVSCGARRPVRDDIVVVEAGHGWRAGRRGRVGSRPWTQCGRAQRVRAASERHACAIQPRDARAGMHLRRGSPTKHVAWSDDNFGTMTFVTFARPHPSQPPGRARDPRTPTGGRLWLPIRSQNHVTMMHRGLLGLDSRLIGTASRRLASYLPAPHPQKPAGGGHA